MSGKLVLKPPFFVVGGFGIVEHRETKLAATQSLSAMAVAGFHKFASPATIGGTRIGPAAVPLPDKPR